MANELETASGLREPVFKGPVNKGLWSTQRILESEPFLAEGGDAHHRFAERENYDD